MGINDQEISSAPTSLLLGVDEKSQKIIPVGEVRKSFKVDPHPYGFLKFRGVMPPNCEEWKLDSSNFIVTPEQLSWLPRKAPTGAYIVNLDHLTLQGNQKKPHEIYLGVLMPNKELLKHLRLILGLGKQAHNPQLKTDQLHSIEGLFFAQLTKYLNNEGRKIIRQKSCQWPLINPTNGEGGDRIYFIEPGRFNDSRLIIIVGACKKTNQEDFFRSIGIV